MTIRREGPRSVIRILFGLIAFIACGAAAADPPARVARMANIDGAVSFSPAGEDDWVTATANRPLITGDRVWADADARAELQIGTLAVRLGNQTSVVILNLDDRVAQFQLQQGVLNVRVRSMGPDETIEVDTPLLAFSLRRPGVYRVDVDPATGATGVTVASGQGDVYGETVAYTVGERQWYRFSDAALRDYQYDTLPPADRFDEWTQALDRSEDNAVAARYVSPEVIGSSDLDRYGTWTVVEGYGNAWVPTAVASDWAPYSDGRWAWIEPWGWTWVDAAPWGFAPFHYGRWAYARERWCWVPGPQRERAVYAPALVAFVGGGNFSVSVGGGPARGIAWFPLAPGEVYRPSYHVSRNYFTRVNASNTNVTNVTITNVYNRPDTPNAVYRNRNQRGAVTAMPATQFAQSHPVARSSTPLAGELARTAPVTSVASIAPVRASVLGGGAAAGAAGAAAAPAATRPPSAILRRPAVARIAPPPPPTPFSAREAALAKDPGRPLDPATVAPPRTSPNGPSATPPVKLVPPQVAATPPAAPAGPRARTNAAPPRAVGVPPAPPRPGLATPAAPTPKPPMRPDAANAPKADGTSPAASPPARVPPSSPNAAPQAPQPPKPPEARPTPPRPPAPASGAPAAPAPSPAPAEAKAPKVDGAPLAASPPGRLPPSSSNAAPQAPQPPRPPEARPTPPRPPAPASGAPTAPAQSPAPAELKREPRPAPTTPAPGSEARREAPPAPAANRPPPASSELRREPPAAPPARPAVVAPAPPQPVVRPPPPVAPAAPVTPPVRQPDAKAEPAKNDAPKSKPDEPK